MKVGVVILPAGESARMGVPKQLLDFRGKALLQHAIDIARSLSGARVAIVLGAHAAEIRAGLSEADAHIVENPDWRSGMGGSLRAGLGALIAAHPELSAAIMMLSDQPLVTQQTLADLVAAHAASGRAIVASEYAATLGVPALFARAMFTDLLACDGSGGASQFIRAHRDCAIGIPFQEGAIDIDTPADYEALCGMNSNHHLSPTPA